MEIMVALKGTSAAKSLPPADVFLLNPVAVEAAVFDMDDGSRTMANSRQDEHERNDGDTPPPAKRRRTKA